MTVVADEFVLTDEMKDAIRSARFKTTNVERSHCWIMDADVELIRRIGQPFVEYQPELVAAPQRVGYQVSTSRPELVAFVGSLVDAGRSKPPWDPSTAPIPF